MRKCLLFGTALIIAAGGLAAGQMQETNPGQRPNVFLGGPKEKKDKTPTSRTLRGTVTDDTGAPLEGALVTLLNTKNNQRQTFITKKDGRYNFSDLSFNIDYKVSAKFKNLASDTRSLSQYDHTVTMVRILQVEDPSPNGSATHETAAQAGK